MTVREALDEMGLWQSTELTLDDAPTMASPSWWGADSERFSVQAANPDAVAGAAAFVKSMQPHARNYVDVESAFAAAVEAGKAGIGPEVYVADVDRGVLVMQDLTAAASTATLDLFDESDTVRALVELHTSVHSFTGLTRRSSVFDDVRTALTLVQKVGAAVPKDLDWMLRGLAPAEQRIEAVGYDAVPCHGDGNVSNVLVLAEDKSLRLVDWDCAAVMDPLQDLGSLLLEVRPLDVDARELFEMYWGSWDSRLFDRSRVYAVADCLRWALIGSYADAARPGTLEYSKFSDWQFLRARAGLRDPHFDDRVRNL